jgi:hypothetical protein
MRAEDPFFSRLASNNETLLGRSGSKGKKEELIGPPDCARADQSIDFQNTLSAGFVRGTRMPKTNRGGWKTCSRGHKYRGPGPCPICWPKKAVRKRAALFGRLSGVIHGLWLHFS